MLYYATDKNLIFLAYIKKCYKAPCKAAQQEEAGRPMRKIHANSEMKSIKNMLLHGAYLTMYSIFKYQSFPLSNYFRYGIIKIFARKIHAKYISDGVHLWFPWNIQIGKFSSLNQGVLIDGYGGVVIGENVRIAAYVTINTADHGFSSKSGLIRQQGYVVAPIYIGDDVWIGTQACINKGVTIGRGSVIGAGSVVTKDIPPYSVAVGNPCHVIRKRDNLD